MGAVHQELIKELYRIRKYLREFYIFGFRSYDEFDWKSKETYYDERARIANWLGEGMVIPSSGHKTEKDFIAIHSRDVKHNPLYNAWKARIFTDGQLSIHFAILCAITESGGKPIDKDAAHPENYLDKEFSDNSVINMLNKYADKGIFERVKDGKKFMYKPNVTNDYLDWKKALDFFSEVAPCGVIGSFALDKIQSDKKDIFNFKHNYMSSALDDEIMANVFEAIHNEQAITIEYTKSYNDDVIEKKIVPLKVLIGASTGRNYIAAKEISNGSMNSFRMDYIMKITGFEKYDNYHEEKERFIENEKYLWGVSFGSDYPKYEKISFSIKVDRDEHYIVNRLMRERRNGAVHQIDDNEYLYEAELFDSNEAIPWIRSFLGYITELNFSNGTVQKKFMESVDYLIKMYSGENEQ